MEQDKKLRGNLACVRAVSEIAKKVIASFRTIYNKVFKSQTKLFTDDTVKKYTEEMNLGNDNIFER